MKVKITTLDEEFEKARTPGAKDLKKRRTRRQREMYERSESYRKRVASRKRQKEAIERFRGKHGGLTPSQVRRSHKVTWIN